jgi:Glycosyltransferase family 87
MTAPACSITLVQRSWMRSIPWQKAGLAYAAASAAWFFVQAIRGLRGLPIGHYMFNIAASRVLMNGGSDIYDPAAQQAAAKAYLNTHLQGQIETFIHPPQAAWVLLPLAHLNAYFGFALFLSASIVCVAFACLLFYRRVLPVTQNRPARLIVVISCCCSVPAAWGIWYGEWDPILLLPAAAAVVLAEKGKRFSSGLLLSLLFLKPNLVWLVPVVLLGARQWRMVAAMAAGGCMWLVTTPLILGINHVADWTGALHSNWDATLFSLGVPGMLSGITQSQAVAFWTAVVMAAACASLSWRYGRRLRGQTGVAIALGLTASLLSTPYAFRYDLIFMAVPLCVWARARPVAAILTAVFMSAVELVNERLVLYDKNLEVLAPLAILAGLVMAVRSDGLSLQGASSHHAQPA